MNTITRLSRVYNSSKMVDINDSSKIIIMSDCHRGVGGANDNFIKNQNLFHAALNYYLKENYTYIELGDGDELWENKYLSPIIANNLEIFTLMAQFYKQKRLYMLFGNHDIIKRNKHFREHVLREFYDEHTEKYITLFPHIEINEGLILRYTETNDKILLTHGHQGDFLNDDIWKTTRFLVRHIWRPLELIGIRNPTSAASNDKRRKSIEQNLIDWTIKNKRMLITGHTHKPFYPKVGEHLYFNDGSCTHFKYITGIEILNGSISLVKWSIKTRADRTLYIARETIFGPIKLKDYFSSENLLK